MDTLSEASILSNLKTNFVGQHVIYFPRLSSTMDAARQAAREGAAEGTLVIAEEQTAGRGRAGRTWFSHRGGLAYSIILHPVLPQLSSLIMIASLAVAHSIESLTPLHAGIKWPNDVLINGKKVCGILIENALKGAGVDFSIVGVGLNVNGAPPTLSPPAIPATSLSNETGKEIPRLRILYRLMEETEQLYTRVVAGNSLVNEWRHRLVTLGQQVQVGIDGITITGIAEDVEEDGSLLLRGAGGKLIKVVAGDVSLRVI